MAFKDYLFNNLGWKLLSVLFAVLIWMVVHSSKQGDLRSAAGPVGFGRTVSMQLPLTVMTATSSGHMFRVNPGTVEVTLTGDVPVIERLRESEVEVFVNLVDVVDARSLRKKVQVHAPVGVSLVKVVPPDVRVEAVPIATTQSTHSTD